MNIKILGTGAILNSYQSPAHLIDNTILVDIPNGCTKSMVRLDIPFSNIDILLITHFHGDHYFDLPFLLLHIGLRIKRDKPFYIIAPKNIEKVTETLFYLAFPDEYKTVLENGKIIFFQIENDIQSFEIGNYIITAYKVNHGNIDAFGYTVSNKINTIGFSGDSLLCSNIERIVELSDLSILDMAFIESKSGHMGLKDLLYIKDKFINKTIIPTHMSDAARQEASKYFTIYNDFSEINI